MLAKASLRFTKIYSVIGFILMIMINTLASTLPINGKTTGEISDMYPNLFVPAGLTFSIWGVIYLFLLLYTLYQTGLFTKHSTREIERIQGIGGLYFLSCIANAAWILCWHFNAIIASVDVMLVLLITLIVIYKKTRLQTAASNKEKLFVSAPFSLYLGWITVATIANITALLVSLKWNALGLPPEYWTVAVIVVAVIITLIIQRKFRDVLYSGVVVWAFIGIIIRHVDTYKSESPVIIGAVGLGIVVVLIGARLMSLKRSMGNKLGSTY